jgi:hypothetical protein
MEEAILQIGLPVKCAYGDCEITGFVKPHSDYGGWYKSKMFRFKPRKRWYCPEHHEAGRQIDNKFYENYRTPEPYTDKELDAQKDMTEELYKLLD